MFRGHLPSTAAAVGRQRSRQNNLRGKNCRFQESQFFSLFQTECRRFSCVGSGGRFFGFRRILLLLRLGWQEIHHQLPPRRERAFNRRRRRGRVSFPGRGGNGHRYGKENDKSLALPSFSAKIQLQRKSPAFSTMITTRRMTAWTRSPWRCRNQTRKAIGLKTATR